jgi:hypothetical protein
MLYIVIGVLVIVLLGSRKFIKELDSE